MTLHPPSGVPSDPSDTADLLRVLEGQLDDRSGPCPLHDLDDHRDRQWWTITDLRVVMYPDVEPRPDGKKSDDQGKKEALLRHDLSRLLKEGLVEKREGPRCECPRDIESVNDHIRLDPSWKPYSQSQSKAAYRLTADGVAAAGRCRPPGPYL